MLIERLIPYACEVDETALGVPEAESRIDIPKTLLPNLGIVSLSGYVLDLEVRVELLEQGVNSAHAFIDAECVQWTRAYAPGIQESLRDGRLEAHSSVSDAWLHRAAHCHSCIDKRAICVRPSLLRIQRQCTLHIGAAVLLTVDRAT